MEINLEEITNPIKNYKLPKLADWDEETTNLFESYLLAYEELPDYKKALNSMIKFKDMYRPIQKGSLYVDAFGYLAGINAERAEERARVYMLRKKILTTYAGGRGKTLILTSTGQKIFYEQYPLAKLRRKSWNGIWTIVMYDIPEKERRTRNFLRRKLEDLGFGAVQKSVLVSPLPLEEGIYAYLEGEKLEENVWVLRAKSVFGISNTEVVEKAWPIVDEISLLYERLYDAIPHVKQAKDPSIKEEWRMIFLAINTKDPYLPSELLPTGWAGERCEKEFRNLTFPFLKRIIYR